MKLPRFRRSLPPPRSASRFSLVLRRLALVLVLSAGPGVAAESDWAAGVARVDITPDGPVRLSGYASRQTESEGVAQRLWAKALALWHGDEPPVVIVTIDNCGVCEPVAGEAARRIGRKSGLARERIAFCSSHTHSAPHTRGFAPNIFVADLPPEQQARLDSYSDTLTDKLEAVVLDALARRAPARLSRAQGEAGFARNRRTEGGPVDHALPVLVVRAPDGAVRAVVANYACHCTTLGGEMNQTHGDWAGCAQEEIERRVEGATALITIGCGADANPFPRGSVELAQTHGTAIATEVERLLGSPGVPLRQPPVCRLERPKLPFAALPELAKWEALAPDTGILGYHARKRLAERRAGTPPVAELSYLIQTWAFGNDLALVFLAGEVVVDYPLRLKKSFDPARLWITAYANDVPCYIPSRRILAEGGYEAETSLWYYDRPTRLAPECEDMIIERVQSLLPAALRTAPAGRGEAK